MAQFALTLTDLCHGSIEVHVSAAEQRYAFTASYFNDAVRDLARSIVAMCENRQGNAHIYWSSWVDEPGEHRLMIHPFSPGQVTLRVFRYAGVRWHSEDETGQEVFTCVCTALRLLTQVTGQLRQLRNEYGEPGYAEAWHHEFPADLLEALEAKIAEHKQQQRINH